MSSSFFFLVFISLGSRVGLTHNLKNDSQITGYIDLMVFASTCPLEVVSAFWHNLM